MSRRAASLASCLVVAGLLLTALAGAYVTLIQPGAFRPVDRAAAERDAALPVFAYGTLESGIVRFAVTRRVLGERPATLDGWRQEGRDIFPDPTASVDGVVFEVGPTDLVRLDRYEKLGTVYERIVVTLEGGESAWVYRKLPGAD